MFKKVLSLGLLTVMMASTMPVYAKGTIQPSDWALTELNDAQFYGVTPEGFEKVLQEVVTQTQIDFIAQALRNKCIEAGLVESGKREIGQVRTRGEVLEAYYTILEDYTGDVDLKSDYLTYMTTNEILRGYGKQDYRLEEACTVEEALVLASRLVEAMYDELGLGTEGFLWEVSDENNTVYLLGTVHIGRSEVYPLSKGLRTALEEADKVAVEVDFQNQEEMVYFAQKQLYLDGTTLANHIDEEIYKRTIKVLEKAGIPESNAKRYKPWALANTLTVLSAQTTDDVEKAGDYQPIDMYVYNKAMFEEKDIIEIEGYAFQSDLFESIPVEYQIQNLKDTLDMVESMAVWNEEAEAGQEAEEIEVMNAWIKHMKTRDIASFEASYGKDEMLENGDFMSKLLFEGRDEHMTAKVVEYLEDESNATYLVAVGMGHMVGEGGIVEALRKLGYTVNIVPR